MSTERVKVSAAEHAKRVSPLVAQLARQIANYRLPEAVPEHQFAKLVGRLHRFDFAWPEWVVGVECDGFRCESVRLHDGRMQKVIVTGHGTPSQLQADAFKRNMAAMLGWTVLVFHENSIENGTAIAALQRVLVAKGWKPRHSLEMADQPF